MNEEINRCRFCGEEILAIANKCKHCGSNLEEAGSTVQVSSKQTADYGLVLLAIPVIATMLIWLWVANMNLLQSPSNSMDMIMLATILGTAIVAAMEARSVGMNSDRNKGTYSPTVWFFIITFLWVVGYPVYLYKRKYFALSDQFVAGGMVALIFIGSWGFVYSVVESEKAKIRNGLEQVMQQLNSPVEGLQESNHPTPTEPLLKDTTPSMQLVQTYESSPYGDIEQEGICNGLNLLNSLDQIECAQRKYENVDKELNKSYRQLMASLEPSRKAIVKKEQIAWIKEKETTCEQEEQATGGQMGRVVGMNCFVTMTEQRLAYLKNYK